MFSLTTDLSYNLIAVNLIGIFSQKLKSIKSGDMYRNPAILANDALKKATKLSGTVGPPLLRFGL